MKRFIPYAAAVAGAIALWLLLPLYTPAQPRGIRLTRPEAQRLADQAARKVGIPVDRSWSALTWYPSPLLAKELRNHPRASDAYDDPVLGPRLDSYQVNYYQPKKDKFPPQGTVLVDGRTGAVTGAHLRLRPEDAGSNAREAELRPRADAFVRSQSFAGAPAPAFESARPTVMRGRTDWVFRYRVASQFSLPRVVPYLNVYFAGNQLTGWELSEEYADGSQYYGETGADIASALAQFVALFIALLVLLVIFLRKYHAGEVGVNAASFLFAVMIVLSIAATLLTRVSSSETMGLGSLDARMTSWASAAFVFLFAQIPSAVLLFLAWAVGESYARERWGERLAGFDAILHRDPLNATVGRSLLCGSLFAPAVAAASFLIGAIPLVTGYAHPSYAGGTRMILSLGGPLSVIFYGARETLVVAIAGILFLLAWTRRHHVLWLGVIAAAVICSVANTASPSIEPVSIRTLFGFGGIAVTIAVFLGWDLLCAATALFGGVLMVAILPLLSVAAGPLAQDLTITLALPLALIAGFALASLLTNREVAYSHADLAPHVRRIIERERVKAEIDAANRIQAALLPLEAPEIQGASVSSHYRAATEIGGDYFDFLRQPTGEIGIAFGDVSGHGLTSGIVMAMAKAALLVQVDYDASPRSVLEVLNEIVIRTAPRRILMTFFFGLLDPATQKLRFSSAGHLDPYVYRAATGRLESLSSWGFPLGVRRRDAFREHSVAFEAGDRLILYSDGLIEAVDDDGEPFGFHRFEQTIVASGHLGADAMKAALLQAVRRFTRNRPPEDDQTLVVVAFEEPAGLREPAATLLAVPTSESVH